MDYESFYAQLINPLKVQLGNPDPGSLASIVGFDAGGPLSFCTFGRGEVLTTYLSCELAVRKEQIPNSTGRYELLTSCDRQAWAVSVLSDIGRMSLDVAFDNGHTMDIGGWVNEGALRPPLQGVLFAEECSARIEGEAFAILRVIGITRAEMEYALRRGSAALIERLRDAGVYPHTLTERDSVAGV